MPRAGWPSSSARWRTSASEGKLDLIGISNASADTVRRALELVEIACVQNAYSVVNRAEEDELALCEERELAFVPFFPLGSAFTGGPAQLAADPAIAEVAARRGPPPRRSRWRGCFTGPSGSC